MSELRDTHGDGPVPPRQGTDDDSQCSLLFHWMLDIPPMPLSDGTYYQVGGMQAFGTSYIDAEGNPLYDCEGRQNTVIDGVELHQVLQWVSRYCQAQRN